MPTKKNASTPKRIVFIGKFQRIYDEEYIARSFEMLGHTVIRIEDQSFITSEQIINEKPDFVLFTKFSGPCAQPVISQLKEAGIKTVCWLFDLYIGYPREYRIPTAPHFKADYIVTTDGGNDEGWAKYGIKHHLVRQGIYKDECFMVEGDRALDIAFVGSENPLFAERQNTLKFIEREFAGQFHWYGRYDTHEVRSTALNDVYGHTKIVVGDSVYSPHYWSNRVVETLGRGGFLIHADVPGIKKEYPYLVTYERGNLEDLKDKINYYLEHVDEREALRKKNFEWVKKKYTMDKKCNELIKCLKL